MSTNEQLTYLVKGMSCGHCEASVKKEVGALAGVSDVDVNLRKKIVRVSGEQLNDEAIRGAIDEAGYDAVPA
jgi:copper chaperone